MNHTKKFRDVTVEEIASACKRYEHCKDCIYVDACFFCHINFDNVKNIKELLNIEVVNTKARTSSFDYPDSCSGCEGIWRYLNNDATHEDYVEWLYRACTKKEIKEMGYSHEKRRTNHNKN